MKVGLCGLPFSGKSTVFRALVGEVVQPKSSSAGKIQLNIGTLEVREERLENLARLLHSQKITYPKINLIDLAKPSEKAPQGIDTAHIREFDALGIVIGVFSSADPVGDLRNVESEMILADLQIVQNRMEKIKRERKTRPQKEADPELLLLERLAKTYEEERALKDLGLRPDELKMLAGFQLFSLKPMIVIANISEEQLNQGQEKELEEAARAKKWQFLALCAKLEAEIGELAEDEQEEFLKEMGLPGLSRDKFNQICFQALEQIMFFTVVGKEARAWPILQGTTALEAAGCVHSDMEKGFIRAEVINYKDFVQCGSFAVAKERGLLRLESKEYTVQDGDIINFKFSV